MRIKNHYIILRHGQTIYQTRKKNFCYPHPENPPIKLTEKGVKETKKSAKLLKKAKIDLIFSSDFPRTCQTAEILAKELGLKITFDKRLRDVNIGIYHAKPKKDLWQDFPRYSEKRFFQAQPKGESWLECQKRIVGFLKEIDRKYQGKTILIVSHGDPLWLLEGAVRGLKVKELIRRALVKDPILKNSEFKRLN